MNTAFKEINQDGTVLLEDRFDNDLSITEDGYVRCKKVFIDGVEIATSAGITGTILTAEQPNITSIGAQSAALDMNTHLINNVVNPASAQDAATKNYVDTADALKLPLTGGTMSGGLNMGTASISNATTVTAVNLAGTCTTAAQPNVTSIGAQASALNMNTHLINNVTDPASAQDAATKNYVDTADALKLPLTGGQ